MPKQEDLHIVEFEAPEGTCYIEGVLGGQRGKTLIITDIHIPRSLWRKGIGSSLIKQLKEKVGAKRVTAYNIRSWGPAKMFFEKLDIPEIFTKPQFSGKRVEYQIQEIKSLREDN